MKATHTYRVWNSREKALIMRDERMMRQGRNGIPMAITREVLKAKKVFVNSEYLR